MFLCLFWDPVKVLRNIVIFLGLYFFLFLSSSRKGDPGERRPSLIYLFSLFIDVAAPGLTCSTQGGLSLGFSVAAGKLAFFFFNYLF